MSNSWLAPRPPLPLTQILCRSPGSTQRCHSQPSSCRDNGTSCCSAIAKLPRQQQQGHRHAGHLCRAGRTPPPRSACSRHASGPKHHRPSLSVVPDLYYNPRHNYSTNPTPDTKRSLHRYRHSFPCGVLPNRCRGRAVTVRECLSLHRRPHSLP